ncbi:MAG: hypothetical protein EA422_01325 [Gemmatimonadales bacterium]|nr:MAG: hypothetical protein EA422_01325 [Gemmatimonadales bacterium]
MAELDSSLSHPSEARVYDGRCRQVTGRTGFEPSGGHDFSDDRDPSCCQSLQEEDQFVWTITWSIRGERHQKLGSEFRSKPRHEPDTQSHRQVDFVDDEYVANAGSTKTSHMVIWRVSQGGDHGKAEASRTEVRQFGEVALWVLRGGGPGWPRKYYDAVAV